MALDRVCFYAECRKQALYAECRYGECRGDANTAAQNVIKKFTAVIYEFS
jgi:hypothetical protein